MVVMAYRHHTRRWWIGIPTSERDIPSGGWAGGGAGLERAVSRQQVEECAGGDLGYLGTKISIHEITEVKSPRSSSISNLLGRRRAIHQRDTYLE